MRCKILLLCTLFGLTLFPAKGQVKLGVFFDPAVSWFRSDEPTSDPVKARMGMNVGLMVDMFFAKNYAFATGISLFTTGGTIKYKNGITLHTKNGIDGKVNAGGDVLYKIQYLRIPAGLKLKTHMIGRFTYYADLGLDPLIRVGARANYGNETNVGIGKEIKPFNIAFHVGGGAEYSLGKEAALIFGLTYMNAFADMTSPSSDRICLNTIMLRLGVAF